MERNAFQTRPAEANPKLFKNLSKFVEIAKGGRVSNPVPGRAGPKAGLASEISEARQTGNVEDLSDAAVPELEPDLPEEAM